VTQGVSQQRGRGPGVRVTFAPQPACSRQCSRDAGINRRNPASMRAGGVYHSPSGQAKLGDWAVSAAPRAPRSIEGVGAFFVGWRLAKAPALKETPARGRG
jgi:hypothetical protein